MMAARHPNCLTAVADFSIGETSLTCDEVKLESRSRIRDHTRQIRDHILLVCHKYGKIKWLTASNGVEDENLDTLGTG
jgi:hypothetical protein